MSFFRQLPYILAADLQRKVVVDGWQISHLGIARYVYLILKLTSNKEQYNIVIIICLFFSPSLQSGRWRNPEHLEWFQMLVGGRG